MKVYNAIRTAIYCALAVLVPVFVTALAEIETLRYFIGGLMIFYGVEEIVLTAFKSKKHYSLHTLYWNLIEVVIGFTLVVFVETGDIEVTYAVVCVGWAIWSILRESREMVEATEEIKSNKPVASKIVAIVSILESVTVIVMSLTMIIEPGEHHAKLHLYLLSVELLTKALFPVIDQFAEWLEERKHGKEEGGEVTVQLPEVDRAEGEVAASAEQEQSLDKGDEELA